MSYNAYVLYKSQLPYPLKDIPWFIEHSPKLRLWNINGYMLKKDDLFSFMLMANSEPMCFEFHDWIIENANNLELDVSFNNFNILLDKSIRSKYNSIYQFMGNTMNSDLIKLFIQHGEFLQRPKHES